MSDALIFRGLFLAWQAALDACNAATVGDDDEQAQTFYRRMRAIEDYTAARPAETLEAFAFKVLVADDNGDMSLTTTQEALAAEAKAIADRMDRTDAGPVLHAFHAREALRAAAHVFPVAEGLDEDAELDALFWRPAYALDDRIKALPTVTPADLATKLTVATCRGETMPDWNTDPLWQEVRRLVA